MDGLPVGIKDLIDTVDMPTEYGSTLFAGHRPKQDAAAVLALREGGAAILGKTVTVTFGGGDPARTRNPHDTARTPGGSSSGSAAAVGAPTIPTAIGTHARGSTIRPASFCGAYALKPTFGAINRQGVFSAADSMDHLGTFAGSLRDVWIVARHMARLAGGDPGYPGLYGGAAPPAPRKPARLIRLEMAGWAATDEATKAAFEDVVGDLASAGVEIYGRGDDPAIDDYEALLAQMPELWRDLYRFEMRWPMLQYLALYPDDVPPRLKRGLEEGAGLTQETLPRRAGPACAREEPPRRARRPGRRLRDLGLARPRPGGDGSGERDIQRAVLGARRSRAVAAADGGGRRAGRGSVDGRESAATRRSPPAACGSPSTSSAGRRRPGPPPAPPASGRGEDER